MLEKMWQKRNPPAPLVGIKTDRAIMEDSMEIP